MQGFSRAIEYLDSENIVFIKHHVTFVDFLLNIKDFFNGL